MIRQRAVPILAALAIAAAGAGCDAVDDMRSRFGTTDTLAIAGAGSGLLLRLQAPGTMQPGEEGVLRMSVTNQSDTVARHVRLELIVPAWVEPMPPMTGDPEVRMAALPEGGTRFAYAMDGTPLTPGQTQTINQRIRVPAAGIVSGPETPILRIVRARLLGLEDEALAEVEGEIALAGHGPPIVADGTASRRDQIGAARLGMTALALRQAVPSARDTTWTQAGVAQRGWWVPVGGEGGMLAVLSGDSVARLEVRHPGIRTDEGLGVGSTLAELRSAYGAACADVVEGSVAVWFAAAPGLRFALDAPLSGSAAQVRGSPDGLSGTARVTRWWAHAGPHACPQ